MGEPRIRVGIDTGGTFTDVVAVDELTGSSLATKVPSTPADPADGFLAALQKILDELGAGMPAVSAVCHGTTVATNRLLEGKVDDLGFITTEGYRHILEIARQSVPDGYGNSYFWVKPPRIVPVDRIRTVRGRLAFDGTEVRPFDEDDAMAAARFFRKRGITTIGVCFLHSYANPEHERRMRDVLAREHPDATVSISAQVLREYREYERSVTTLVDAAVKPSIRRYIATIAARLDALASGDLGLAAATGPTEANTSDGGSVAPEVRPAASTNDRREAAAPDDAGIGGEPAQSPPRRTVPFYVMRSNGGVLSADEVVEQPISTVLSGPAAGALGAAVVAQAAGHANVLTLDGGGTSTDVTVVVAGHPALTTEGTVGSYPSKIPMIDVATVGAGGGSVAWVSPEGTLKVGPHSAGADPGPMCYGAGGTEPTVTDAHLLLGRIPPHLLGGEIPLDAGAARAGVTELGKRLDLDVERCAAGILEISAWNQANALRQITVKRGLDVRDFTLVSFGGSGSLLACRLVDVLDLDGVLVPPNPGNLSAYGLLTVDVRNDYVRTAVSRHSVLEHATATAILDGLRAEADAALQREGFAESARRFVRSADLRYYGQAFEVRVDVPGGPVTPELANAVADAFHAEHRKLYGYDFRGDPRQEVEWVNLRVTGVGPIRKPEMVEVGPGDGARASSHRPVHFDEWADTPVYRRETLGAGDVVAGPAVVEEFGSTVPVHPGFATVVDHFGNLVIRRGGSP